MTLKEFAAHTPDNELNPEKNEKFGFIKRELVNMFRKEEIKFKLIYKATKDGDSIDNFHYYCDNISNTLIIIKTKQNKIFDGFTSELLNLDENLKKDSFAFLFLVDKQKYIK